MKRLRKELESIAESREEARLDGYENEAYYAALDQRDEEIRSILYNGYAGVLRDELSKYLKSTIDIRDFIGNIVGSEIDAEDDHYEVAPECCVDSNPHTVWFNTDLS